LGFKIAIAPALWISGLLLLFYTSWKDTALGAALPLEWVAWVHMGAVFALLIFLVAHVYLAATMGEPWYSLLKSMFTGYEEVKEGN
jgi:thiosulfate reductase cytochrome b subunit